MTLVYFCVATAFMAVGQQNMPGSTRVAVVDIPAVSERYERTADLEARFNRKRIELNRQRDALREKIERTGRSMQEGFKPGTKEYEQRSKELALYEAELRWFEESESQRIEAELAGSLRSIYDDIHEAVREVAEEHGIDVVLAADRLPGDAAKNTTQARQQIVLQKVVYWSPRVDLTDEVVTRLNAKYRSQRPASPSGLAQPPGSQEHQMSSESPGRP